MSNKDTRTSLLETALELIWQSNYNSVGVNEICKQAGVTKGSFYHHFESKAVLFCEATEYYWRDTKKAIDEILSPINPPLQQLQDFMRFVFARKFDEHSGKVLGSPYFTCGAQTGCENQMINDSLKQMCDNGLIYNTALLKGLQSAGHLDASVDAERSARMLSQYIQGAIGFARIEGDIAAIKKDFREAFFRLIGLRQSDWFDPFAA